MLASTLPWRRYGGDSSHWLCTLTSSQTGAINVFISKWCSGMSHAFQPKISDRSTASQNGLHHIIERAWRYPLIYRTRIQGLAWTPPFLETVTYVNLENVSAVSCMYLLGGTLQNLHIRALREIRTICAHFTWLVQWHVDSCQTCNWTFLLA